MTFETFGYITGVIAIIILAIAIPMFVNSFMRLTKLIKERDGYYLFKTKHLTI